VRPEHAVEMFRLFGGGIMGDTPAGLPNAQLAIIRPFLDAPIKTAE